jgi:hypothetical protein
MNISHGKVTQWKTACIIYSWPVLGSILHTAKNKNMLKIYLESLSANEVDSLKREYFKAIFRRKQEENSSLLGARMWANVEILTGNIGN